MLEKLSEPPDPYILVLMGSGVLIALVAWLPLGRDPDADDAVPPPGFQGPAT